jgi:hypothetical protein
MRAHGEAGAWRLVGIGGSSMAGSGDALACGAGEADASTGAALLAGSGDALAVGAVDAPPALPVFVPSVPVVDCELPEHASDAAQTIAMNPERQERFMLIASLHFRRKNGGRLDRLDRAGCESVHQVGATIQENFRERQVHEMETCFSRLT